MLPKLPRRSQEGPARRQVSCPGAEWEAGHCIEPRRARAIRAVAHRRMPATCGWTRHSRTARRTHRWPQDAWRGERRRQRCVALGRRASAPPRKPRAGFVADMHPRDPFGRLATSAPNSGRAIRFEVPLSSSREAICGSYRAMGESPRYEKRGASIARGPGACAH